MPDSKFFGIPFGASGDKATIPEAAQPGGAVSYQQGFGPDYERDPATDPLAKRVPRDETNEFYFQVSNAVRFLQLYGLPEWFAIDDSGNPVSYPLTARVRHIVGGTMRAWVSIAATNTVEPGSDPTKWVEDVAFSIPRLEASLPEMLAGVEALKITTPRRVASSVQAGKWSFALGGGSASTHSATLAPAPSQYYDGMRVVLVPVASNTGAATLNLNGLGASPVLRPGGGILRFGDLRVGFPTLLIYLGGNFYIVSLTPSAAGFQQIFAANGSFTVPDGVFRIRVRLCGGGGGAGGSGGDFTGGGGAGGGYAEKYIDVIPGAVYPVTVGLGGTAGSAIGGTGGTSSFGTEVSATGGGGGRSASVGVAGGQGGVGSGGSFNIQGGDGAEGVLGTNQYPGGHGGSTVFGGAGRAGIGAGLPGGAPGAGGGAVWRSGGTGGAGFRGVVIVDW